MLRVMIAGGGTGGHIYPGIAIYRSLKHLCGDIDALFVGARGSVESGIFSRQDLPHLLLPGRGIRGASVLSKTTAPFVFGWSVIQAVKAILAFKPDVVVGTGGYASVSTVAAAAFCGKLRVVQEQNIVPGLANRLLSRIASLVLLSYEESRSFINASIPSVVVGNPLRIDPEKAACEKSQALEFFGFNGDFPTILIFGGSRGARSINEAGVEAAKEIVKGKKAQIVFITGEQDFARVHQELEKCAPWVKVLPFLEEIECAYAIADLAVARAGASSVFELAAFGIPTVFIPYPFAADDHQRKNVAPLLTLEAAVVIEDSELNGEVLAALVRTLLDDEKKRIEISGRLRSWVKAHAALQAAEAIVDIVKKNACSKAPDWGRSLVQVESREQRGLVRIICDRTRVGDGQIGGRWTSWTGYKHRKV